MTNSTQNSVLEASNLPAFPLLPYENSFDNFFHKEKNYLGCFLSSGKIGFLFDLGTVKIRG